MHCTLVLLHERPKEIIDVMSTKSCSVTAWTTKGKKKKKWHYIMTYTIIAILRERPNHALYSINHNCYHNSQIAVQLIIRQMFSNYHIFYISLFCFYPQQQIQFFPLLIVGQYGNTVQCRYDDNCRVFM